MKLNIKLFLTMLFLSTILLSACSEESMVKEEAALVETPEASPVEEVRQEEMEEEEETPFLPEQSQQISEFPWDEDEQFLKAQEEHDTNVLIGGYVTVAEGHTSEEYENMRLAFQKISGTILAPGETFSQNDIAGPYTEEMGYKEGIGYVGGEPVKDFGGGVCNVATTLYNATIASHVDVVERHNHSMPVPYVPYGQDAAVAYGYKDYQFNNNTDHPLLIWAELIDDRLYVGFYGDESGPEVTWEHETLSETKTSTQYRTNPNLDKNEEKVLVEGMDGKVVESKIKLTFPDGAEEWIELGQSSYNPLTHLIETGAEN